MERPKSSKYNFTRRKTFYKSETPCLENEVEIQVISQHDETIASKEQSKKLRKNERHMQIKSAYPTFQQTLCRPQSARHNLDKYRQDIKQETKALKNVSNQAKFIDLMDNNELDDLDYLYIREEESSGSEDENEADNVQNKQPLQDSLNKKLVNKKQKKSYKAKLLKQRQDMGDVNTCTYNNTTQSNILHAHQQQPTLNKTSNNLYNRSNTVSILKNPLSIQQVVTHNEQQHPYTPQTNLLKTSTSNLLAQKYQIKIAPAFTGGHTTQHNTNQNIPWLKQRNRDLCAHQVLMKHKAELEELSLKNSIVNTNHHHHHHHHHQKSVFLTSEKFLRK